MKIGVKSSALTRKKVVQVLELGKPKKMAVEIILGRSVSLIGSMDFLTSCVKSCDQLTEVNELIVVLWSVNRRPAWSGYCSYLMFPQLGEAFVPLKLYCVTSNVLSDRFGA